MKKYKSIRRVLAMALSVVMALGMLTVSATANTLPVGSSGEIIAFDELSDEIRWQNTRTPELPPTLSGAAEGEQAEIPVTWEADHTYDADAPARGLYVFTAVPREGYTLMEGLSAPRITVYIPEGISMFSRGSGTAASSLELTTAAQLAEIAVLVNAGRLESFLFNDANVKVSLKLANDIDLSGYASGEGWVPIGVEGAYFKGNFDGDGHKITGLTINRPTGNYQGLFGYMDGAAIQNLGVVGVSITGKDYIGSIAGEIDDSTIQNCYSTGTIVHAAADSVDTGGLIGYVGGASMIGNCYVYAAIVGEEDVGGVVGYLGGDSVLKNCFAFGGVNGGSHVGGIAGYTNDEASVENCYAANSVTGGAAVGGVVGSAFGALRKCAALNISVDGNFGLGRVMAAAGFEDHYAGNVGFDGIPGIWGSASADDMDGAGKTAAEIGAAGFFQTLFGNDSAWTYAPGKLPGLFGAAVEMPIHIADKGGAEFLGSGTSTDPWQIRTAAELKRLSELVNAGTAPYASAGKYYQMMRDIDLSNYADGEGWVAIGHPGNSFEGIFDGNGHKITGLYINITNPSIWGKGLFGRIGYGEVRNLALVNVDITVQQSVGAVAGIIAGGVVENCSVSGSVSGQLEVGGVVGTVYSPSMVKNCYSNVTVTGTGPTYEKWIGGVAGLVSGGWIQNCLATGPVKGIASVGGIAGELRGSGTVKACAALNTSVTGTTDVGRVAGYIMEGSTVNNVSYGNMPGTWGSVGGSTINGATMDVSQMESPGVWSTDSNWGGSGWGPSVWTLVLDKLPGLFGVALEIPPHITETDSGGMFWGAGTSGDPYQIRTAADLEQLATLVNAGTVPYADAGKYYKLMNDLDLSGYASGEGWVPIGQYSSQFKGNFNGNGKVITGLVIKRSYSNQGLFRYIAVSGAVRNLGIKNANITLTDTSSTAGIVAGTVYGIVEGCYTTGSVSGYSYVGGIAGMVPGTMRNCYSTASIIGQASSGYVGGVAGFINPGGTVENCYSTGTVKGTHGSASKIGGIAGEVQGVLKNCAALNPSITGKAAVGRVLGATCVDETYTLAGNVAFGGIPGTWNNIGADGLDGAGIALKQIYSRDFWRTAANWDTAGWDESVWTLSNGKLPVLKNVGGAQSGDGGLYLAERDIAHTTVQVTGTYTYTGSIVTPNVTVTFDGNNLEKDVHYTVSSSIVNAGAATATLTGIGDFIGTKDIAFTIQKATPAAPTVTGSTAQSGSTFTYTVDVISGAEYRMDSGGWQDSNIFSGIAPGGSHTFYARIMETTNFNAGAAGSTGAIPFVGEQFSLAPGGTYFFDLSGQNVPGTVNEALPDGSLKWVPFTYAGTVNAYSLDASSSGNTSASAAAGAARSDRSLFVADYNITKNVSWDVLSGGDLIFGRAYSMGGIDYTLRSLSVGSVGNGQSGAAERGVPQSNEWDQLLNKDGAFIRNWSGILSWGQDTASHLANRDVRGYTDVRHWGSDYSGAESWNIGFRPTLEIQNPAALGVDGLKTVTYAMDSSGTLGSGSLESATVIYAGTLTLPEIISANGFTYTDSGTGALGWYDGTTFHHAGTTPALASGAVLKAGREIVPPSALTGTALISNTNPRIGDVLSGSLESGNNSGTLTYTWEVGGTQAGTGVSYTVGAADLGKAITLEITSSVETGTVISVSTAAVAKKVAPAAPEAPTLALKTHNSITLTANAAYEFKMDSGPWQSGNVFSGLTKSTVYTFYQRVAETADRSASAASSGLNIMTDSQNDGGVTGGGSAPAAAPVAISKQPDMPTVAKINVPGTVKDGILAATITEQTVKEVITAAQDAAKKSGEGIDGIAVEVGITNSGSYTDLNAMIATGAINSLKETGIKFIKIGSDVLDITFDANAISEMNKQSSGTVIISARVRAKLSDAAKALIGSRPVFDITTSYQKNGKIEHITNFGNGVVTLGIAYKATSAEAAGSLFGVYVDKNGKPQVLTNSSYAGSKVIFSRNSLSIYGVGYKAPAPVFTDTVGHWAKDNIDFVVGRDLISGTSAATFAPDTAITRATFVMALGKLSGADVSGYKVSSFSDVNAVDSALPYIEWAVKSKTVSGYDNGTFGPNDAITREQMAVMMKNYAEATGYKLPIARQAVIFADDAKISTWAREAVKAIQQTGIIVGKTDNLFDPQGSATRAEASTILRRFVELVADEGTARGWNQNDAGQWQYIGENGKPVTGWLDMDSKRYYFTKDGVMVADKWLELDGKWYYFYIDGSLAKNTKVDSFKVDENGVRKTK